ncbi:MAG: hypothetical protein EA350_16635 [Gemmatimonadales bacterium]|nr:MAG: hypothetical protein EA350_16635 [Gemmatimonadales bacterium]
MGRILLLLLVAFGIALYVPESRAAIAEAAQPLANPAYRWMSHQQMTQIVDDLEISLGTGARLPVARGEFDGWLDRRYRQARSREDAWGTRYQLRVRGNAFEVMSAGPDGIFGTEDDLLRTGSMVPAASR